MEAGLLDSLEQQIKSLIQKFERLQHENAELRRAKGLLAMEKEQIVEKQKSAISQIENMVTRLKSIEKPE